MSKQMNDWFSKQDFNTAPLPQGHKARFLERLDGQTTRVKPLKSSKVIAFMNWKVWAVAASIILLLGIGYASTLPSGPTLAEVSPEMAASQDFFNKTIHAELAKLEQQQSPQTERIIADTKKNLTKLEQDYIQIATDFKNNSNAAVMETMLLNFKTRVALLENALAHINDLNNIKEQHHETTL